MGIKHGLPGDQGFSQSPQWIINCDGACFTHPVRAFDQYGHFKNALFIIDFALKNGWTIDASGYFKCPDCTADYMSVPKKKD